MDYKHLKENKNPPKVVFRKINGRIIPIVSGKRSPKARRALYNKIENMNYKVVTAQAGKRHIVGYGKDRRVISEPSTFPKFFKKTGFKTKKQWAKSYKNKNSAGYKRIVEHAKNSIDFKLATKQVYDNKYVGFRTIKGKVRPIRSKNKQEFEKYEFERRYIKGKEVPF